MELAKEDILNPLMNNSNEIHNNNIFGKKIGRRIFFLKNFESKAAI